MEDREIEELLARVALPPAPQSLRDRILSKTSRSRQRGICSLRLSWYRALEAAAALAMLAGAAGRAY